MKYFKQLGTTVELTLLGGTGLATMDPEKIEAVLSTHFDSMYLGSIIYIIHVVHEHRMECLIFKRFQTFILDLETCS